MSNAKVYEVVWPWRTGGKPAVAKQPMPAKTKAVIQAVVMAVVGLFLYKVLGHHTAGKVVWALAVVVLVSGLFIPPVFKAIEHFGALLGKWVGTGLTWGLLAPFYYVVFSLGRLFLTLTGKDLLCCKFPTQEATYWTPHKARRNLDQYGKQF